MVQELINDPEFKRREEGATVVETVVEGEGSGEGEGSSTREGEGEGEVREQQQKEGKCRRGDRSTGDAIFYCFYYY